MSSLEVKSYGTTKDLKPTLVTLYGIHLFIYLIF